MAEKAAAHVAGHRPDFGPLVRGTVAAGQRVRRNGDLGVVEGDAVPRLRILTQTPLDRYRVRRLLAPDSAAVNELRWQAGDRLRCDFGEAGLRRRITGRYGEASCAWAEGAREDAERRYRRALRKVGPDFAGILVHVCCADEAAERWCWQDGEIGRAGLVMLRLALAALARHYRLTTAGS